MKHIALLAVFSLMLAAGNASANFMDGTWLKNALAKDEKAQKEKIPAADAQEGAMAVGYVLGVADALEGAQLLCIADGVKTEQVLAMVSKHLAANPDKWNQPADMLVIEALKSSFPCKK